MAHFGIESIEKKDGYPPQNDFTLLSMARFGIEGLMKSGMVRPENDFGLRVAQ